MCLAEISKMLVAVCENPRNPTFNHYLFESVAAIVRIGLGSADKVIIGQLEMSLLGVVDYVITKEVVEFTPCLADPPRRGGWVLHGRWRGPTRALAPSD